MEEVIIEEVVEEAADENTQKKRGLTTTRPVWARYHWVRNDDNKCRYCDMS